MEMHKMRHFIDVLTNLSSPIKDDAYKLRLKGFHMITSSEYVTLFPGLLILLKPELMKRIHH